MLRPSALRKAHGGCEKQAPGIERAVCVCVHHHCNVHAAQFMVLGAPFPPHPKLKVRICVFNTNNHVMICRDLFSAYVDVFALTFSGRGCNEKDAIFLPGGNS